MSARSEPDTHSRDGVVEEGKRVDLVVVGPTFEKTVAEVQIDAVGEGSRCGRATT